MKKIVVINGNGFSGKDSFVRFCGEFAKVENYSSIDTIRECVKHFGYRGGKEERDRKFLSDVKQLCVEYNDFPHKETLDTIRIFYEGGNDFEVLFIHIRETWEISRLKKEYPESLITIFIKNNRVKKIYSNDSDAMVELYQYDYYIDNNGSLEELKESAKIFIEKLRSENENI